MRENLALKRPRTDDFKIHPEALTSSEGTEIFMDRGYSSRLAPIGEKQTVHVERALETISWNRSGCANRRMST